MLDTSKHTNDRVTLPPGVIYTLDATRWKTLNRGNLIEKCIRTRKKGETFVRVAQNKIIR